MHDALTTATATVAVATLLLFIAGRRPLSFPTRTAASAPVVVAAGLGLPVEVTVTLATIALVTVALPRHWYAIGAWLFAALCIAFGLYGLYLGRSVILLGSDLVSIVLGMVLLVLELGAMALILASAFEMVDALCGPDAVLIRPADPDRWPVVCLQVPTYNEPPDLVIETIRSLAALDYPALRVQVIDNNTADEALWTPVEIECARLRGEAPVPVPTPQPTIRPTPPPHPSVGATPPPHPSPPVP